MLDLYDELKTILARFDSEGVPYALCGGLAVSIHTEPRATVDIDVLMPQDALDAAKKSLKACGYDVEAAPMAFAQGKVPMRRLSKFDPDGDILSVDILLVTEATQAVWAAREQLTWEAGPIVVVSKQGLITLKRLRGSKQDEADIEKLSRG
jgi:hypothetical protein